MIILLAGCRSGSSPEATREQIGSSQDASQEQISSSTEATREQISNFQDAAPGQMSYTPEDRQLFKQMMEDLSPHADEPLGELVVLTGRWFLETPYVAHTLEGDREILVINLRELDCTTFAENCLAIARTIRSGSPSFERFAKELRFIRYRDGRMGDYPTRLHYFCDWIYNNEQKGVIRDVSRGTGGVNLGKEIGFMSSHPENYRQLAAGSSLVETIRRQEEAINERPLYHIPESRVGELESRLKAGDIAGITTDIEGLAVMHVGILLPVGGRIHLLHASSSAEKVVISDVPLEDYLADANRATGIICARPL